ncbi:UDP-N-acetylmuramoyl-L-alanyl-D-glutamate--2,6-diaminopimelate ligase [Gallaecimonas sp. GXIMD4217]|uniref:UDP-N-acetylmuramoyl-L-alanyl-D-glutamate--2, 6-diaminopimelate ligase n=1 Tax=Gallaecimonas sp. GXIMD4217 TaxID=3131927 RepID=UPI00311B34C8
MAERNLKALLAPWCQLDSDITVSELVLDSRKAGPGTAFVAIPGHRLDGRDFINAALGQGVGAVISEGEAGVIHHGAVPEVRIPDLRRRLSALALRFYGEPALKAVGVTGTNGKTTTSQLLAQLCEAQQIPAGIIGTLGWGRWGQLTPSLNTTPDAIGVAATLAELDRQGCQVAAMEVSSHALSQGRVSAVPFRLAIFTNLSRDHLDYHGTMGAYAAAKAQLLDWPSLDAAIINLDDPIGEAWIRERKGDQKVVAYSLAPIPAEVAEHRLWLENIRFHLGGVTADVAGSYGEAVITSPLVGRFNLYNLLAAMAAGLELGLPLGHLAAAASTLRSVDGRMQTFTAPGKPMVVVDYAHTPDALAQALAALRPHCRGRLWCLFGCGGDRDPGKRPEMAAVVERQADQGLITADNPRSEAVETIIQQMLAGCRYGEAMTVEPDRRLAIRKAIAEAGPDDVVLIAGKGHEDYQEIAGERLPFSDIDEVQLALAEGTTC